MSDAVLLDASPLSLLARRPAWRTEGEQARRWADALLSEGVQVCVPEIIDYELRRELLRSGKSASIGRLDRLKDVLVYLPLTTETMLLAAQLWAGARNRGVPTAPSEALDIDVILAAQAMLLQRAGLDCVVATSNVRHIERFVPAARWQSIGSRG